MRSVHPNYLRALKDILCSDLSKINQDIVARNITHETISILGRLEKTLHNQGFENLENLGNLFRFTRKILEKKEVSTSTFEAIERFLKTSREYLLYLLDDNKNNLIKHNNLETFFGNNFVSQHQQKSQPVSAAVREKPTVSKRVYQESPNDQELCQVFKEEMADIMPKLQNELLRLEKEPSSTEVLIKIHRYFHTLKGSSRMVELNYLGEAAWMVEQSLYKILNNHDEVTLDIVINVQEMIDVFNRCLIELNINNLHEIDLCAIKHKWLTINEDLINYIDID